MKKLVAAMMCVALVSSGCVMLAVDAYKAAKSRAIVQAAKKNKNNLDKVSVGMSKEDVLSIMGSVSVEAVHKGKKITVTNPYKSETVTSGNKTLEVLYYVTNINDDDGEITDTDLTPLLFDDGILIGQGWDFYFSKQIGR